MAAEVIMPKLGLLMTEGAVVRWLIADGQPVEQGAPIVDIMTKKITYRVVAPVGGTLYHMAQVDENVLIGEPLALITSPGESPMTTTYRHSAATGASSRAGRSDFVPVSPWARNLAQQLGIDLVQVQGSGRDGCVIGRDVIAWNAQTAPSSPPSIPLPHPPSRVQTVPFGGIRKMIARRMTESLHTMAQATLTVEVDVTDMLKLRHQTDTHPSPTHTDIVIKAVASALTVHPQLNAVLLGNEIELLEDIHIGIAVQITDGVLVPVIRNADQRTATEIMQEARRLIKAAHAGELTVDAVTGSTFTVTDLGVYGVDFFAPIINPPEVAILGVGRIVEKPVVYHGKIAVRSQMMLCLTFDHRVVDGAPAAAFLGSLSELLAQPAALFR